MPRSMRPPVISFMVASRLAVTVMSRVAGFVTHVPRRSRSVPAPISVSSGYGSRHRTCESKIQPYEKPFASARCARSTLRLYWWSGLSVIPNFIGLRADEVVVGIGAPVAEELPRLADLLDLVQVEV